MRDDIEEIRKNDPDVLNVFIGEYYFMNKEWEKAIEILSDLRDKNIPELMKLSVKNYLYLAYRQLRKVELETVDFDVVIDYKNGCIEKFDRQSFYDSLPQVGKLVELLDFYLKKTKG